jgi:hypothetical protein
MYLVGIQIEFKIFIKNFNEKYLLSNVKNLLLKLNSWYFLIESRQYQINI